MTHTARKFVMLAFVLLMLGAISVGQAPPSQHTFVSSATPKVNYGPSIALVVGPGSTSNVQFNLAGVPAGATVSKATLRLFVDAVATQREF